MFKKRYLLFLLLYVIVRSFLFEPFKIPTKSMNPTLVVGDQILVNKFVYGVRLPFTHAKILDTGAPERGDVAVFRFPPEPEHIYVKRVIGLPGDTLVYENNIFTINGEAMPKGEGEPYISPIDQRVQVGALVHEEVLGGVTHGIIEYHEFPNRSGTYVVPDGHYFVVGDNRNRSNDSRFWGFVPEENLLGKASYIWMHWNDGVLWSRVATTIE